MLTVGDLVQVLGDLPSHSPVKLINMNGESLNFDIDVKSERHGYSYNSTKLDIITDLTPEIIENKPLETEPKKEIKKEKKFTLRRLHF